MEHDQYNLYLQRAGAQKMYNLACPHWEDYIQPAHPPRLISLLFPGEESLEHGMSIVFIMLINVKIPTIVGILIFMRMTKFMLKTMIRLSLCECTDAQADSSLCWARITSCTFCCFKLCHQPYACQKVVHFMGNIQIKNKTKTKQIKFIKNNYSDNLLY